MGAVTLESVLAGLSPARRERLAAIQPQRTAARIRELTKSSGRAASPASTTWSQVNAVVSRLGENVNATLKGLRLVSEANAHELPFARARRAKKEREAWDAAVDGITPPTRPRRVRIWREGPRLLDSDNVQGSAKHLRDAIAAWLGVDDGPAGPVTWEVLQRKAQGYAVDVEIVCEEASR